VAGSFVPAETEKSTPGVGPAPLALDDVVAELFDTILLRLSRSPAGFGADDASVEGVFAKLSLELLDDVDDPAIPSGKLGASLPIAVAVEDDVFSVSVADVVVGRTIAGFDPPKVAAPLLKLYSNSSRGEPGPVLESVDVAVLGATTVVAETTTVTTPLLLDADEEDEEEVPGKFPVPAAGPPGLDPKLLNKSANCRLVNLEPVFRKSLDVSVVLDDCLDIIELE